jgi:hypothetical protein
MTNPKSEFLGIYAPTLYLMASVFAQQFAECAAGPESSVPGPSGSRLICLGVFFINGLLWLPVGITCVITQVRRSRDLKRRENSGSFIHTITAAIGILLLLSTAKSSQGVPEIWSIIAISGAANLAICGFFFFIGCSLRSYKRLPMAKPKVATKHFPAPTSISSSSHHDAGDRDHEV